MKRRWVGVRSNKIRRQYTRKECRSKQPLIPWRRNINRFGKEVCYIISDLSNMLTQDIKKGGKECVTVSNNNRDERSFLLTS